MPTYSITAPNGKTLDVSGDHVPSEAELHDIFAKAGVATTAAPAPDQTTLPRGWQPAGTHEVPEGPATTSPLADMLGPLAHPQTVTDFARLLTLPVDAVKRAYAGALTLAAGRTTAAAAGDAVTSAAAAAKPIAGRAMQVVGDIDLTKPFQSTLGKAGDALVRSADEARMQSAPGYPRLTSTPAPEVVPPAAAPTEFEAARAARQATAAEPPVLKPGRPGGNPDLPDVKAASEARLAEIRAAYQAKQAPPPAGPVVAASGQMKLTGPEFTDWNAAVKSGTSYAQAYAEVLSKRIAATIGGTVTDAEAAATIARRGYKS